MIVNQDPRSDRPECELVFFPFQSTAFIATASNGPSAWEVSLVLTLENPYVFVIWLKYNLFYWVFLDCQADFITLSYHPENFVYAYLFQSTFYTPPTVCLFLRLWNPIG